ncbi:MAG: putative glycoside hydrolase [Halobacteriota archaeon]
MKDFEKEKLQKALFLLPVSLLAVMLIVSPAAAAPTVSNSGGSSAQGLIHANGPHTYIDWKKPWTGDEAGIAANLAKYDIVALHYTDTAQHVQAIKAINPNTIVLAYFNPLFGGTEGNSHSEWYLRDASGNNPSSGYANEHLMDLTQPGWRAMCVQITQGALQKGFEGLVLDNGITSPNVMYPGSWAGSESTWQSSTTALYTSIKQMAGNKVVIYNGAYNIPGYVNALDGWMDEGFPFYKGWEYSTGCALDASTKGKLTLMYAQGSSADRYFCYCSALLTDGYFFYAPTGTQWFADYGINLGPALNTAHKQSDGSWARDYQSGTVVVNPASKTARIDMKQNQAPAPTPSPKVTPTPTAIVKPTATPAVKTIVKPVVKPTATPSPKVTATPASKAVVKTPTVKPTATPSVKAVVKTPTVKPTATHTPKTAELAPVTTNASNTTVSDVAMPTGQANNVASLPPQPVLEFSVLGLGVPAIVVGLIYLFIRR